MYRAKEAFELLLWGIRPYNWNGKLFFQQIFNNINDFFTSFLWFRGTGVEILKGNVDFDLFRVSDKCLSPFFRAHSKFIVKL